MAARKFYEDEDSVTPLPGTTITASDVEIEALGPNKLINGSSIRSPTFLEVHIGLVRKSFDNLISNSINAVDNFAVAFHRKEESFTNTVSNLHRSEEELFPASLYILIGALSGTVLTRRSNVVFKAVAPLALGLIAFKYTLPQTYNNYAFFAHDLESQNLPQLTEKQDSFIKHVDQLATKTENEVVRATKTVESWSDNLKSSFKKFTGLKLDDDVTKE
ncbi:hypothetical protein WICPIJ_003620 [Wickerhamomyces pijperi]|uniref:MICOS complex subunit n=1 Tax=Wickerhamomyces pijperi TaxID=599730 RepID=A0A9P8TP29_WICPI|nr:hypothetical protein WICPIJ_003620 [Wickerhamomyces pijperi]